MCIVTMQCVQCMCSRAGCGDELVSQCVTDGSVLELDCPVTDVEEYDYVGWTLPSDYDYDEDISGLRRVSMTATRSSASGYDVEELTCSLNDMHYHAMLFITGNLSLTKRSWQHLEVIDMSLSNRCSKSSAAYPAISD